MKQLNRLESLGSAKTNWFRTGVISAAAVAPLIARWRDLRLTAQARAQRERAEASLQGIRARFVRPPQQPPQAPVPQRASADAIRTGLWVSGVVVGLVAAGATAYFIVRRQMAAQEEPLVELPLTPDRGTDGQGRAATNHNGPHALSTTASTARDAASADTAASLSGGALTTSVGADEPTVPNVTSFGPAEVVEPGMPEPGAVPAAEAAPPGATESANAPVATDLDSLPLIDTPEEAEAAPFVGNVHTMVYHDASDTDHLPEEENRIYFASEDEAIAAGFRRDRQEVVPPDTSITGTQPG